MCITSSQWQQCFSLNTDVDEVQSTTSTAACERGHFSAPLISSPSHLVLRRLLQLTRESNPPHHNTRVITHCMLGTFITTRWCLFLDNPVNEILGNEKRLISFDSFLFWSHWTWWTWGKSSDYLQSDRLMLSKQKTCVIKQTVLWLAPQNILVSVLFFFFFKDAFHLFKVTVTTFIMLQKSLRYICSNRNNTLYRSKL